MQLEWANTWTFCLKDIGNYLSVSTMLGKKYVVDKYHHHQLGMDKGIITTLFNRTVTEKSPKSRASKCLYQELELEGIFILVSA